MLATTVDLLDVEEYKPNLKTLQEIICGKWGIVEPYIKGTTLTYYEWEWIDCFRSRKEYYKQEIDLLTGKFLRRNKLKRKPKRYAQHI